MGTFKRADRVGDLLKSEVADLLLRRVRDPRLGALTITGAKVSDDLRTARIYYVEMGKDTSSAEVEAGLKKAVGFLRRELGPRLQLRHVPELQFTYDPSFAYGNRIETLLSQIRSEGEVHDPEDR